MIKEIYYCQKCRCNPKPDDIDENCCHKCCGEEVIETDDMGTGCSLPLRDVFKG